MEKYRQQIEGWKSAFTTPQERTVEGEFIGAGEEFGEIAVAVKNYDGTKESKTELFEELADGVIRLLGIANAADRLHPFDEVVAAKINTLPKKYPPSKIKEYRRQGDTLPRAMKKCKSYFLKN